MKYIQFLTSLDFSHTLAMLLTNQFSSASCKSDEEKKNLAEMISNQYVYAGKVKVFIDTPNTIFFIGSTGVGKTTSLVKIMSNLIFKDKRTVIASAFDVKRLLATAQLEKYVDIIKSTQEVNSDKEVIFHQTAHQERL